MAAQWPMSTPGLLYLIHPSVLYLQGIPTIAFTVHCRSGRGVSACALWVVGRGGNARGREYDEGNSVEWPPSGGSVGRGLTTQEGYNFV
jgi:hypothetical protein